MESHQREENIPVIESPRLVQKPNLISVGNKRQYNCHGCSQQYENVRHLKNILELLVIRQMICLKTVTFVTKNVLILMN